MSLIHKETLEGCNGVLMTLDSCRFDSARLAETPRLDGLGKLEAAQTLSTYTPASHTAMFLGHLPSITGRRIPFYNETVRQPFRITTGPARDAHKGCGLLFEGNNVIDGFRRRGFFTLGVGGVSQFSSGSFLRTQFPWSEFRYFGPDMDEEPLAARRAETFPLNHIEEIVGRLAGEGKWFLFINCPEPHYPYDWGEGMPQAMEPIFPILKRGLNLRAHNLTKAENKQLAKASWRLQQMQIDGLEALDRKIGHLFDGLRQISRQEVFAFVCADHGENFGEQGLWGHMHPSRECLEVPLWMGML